MMNKKLTNKEYKELEDLVYNYPTKHKEGFLAEEEKELLKQFPDINKDKYYGVLTGITCQMAPEGIVTYHCDILQALVCGLENRDQTEAEWD
jgi:hypothetical protein